MGNPLIFVGILLVVAGIAANMMPGVKIPLLPGDIFIQKEGFTLYVPIVSSIVLSIIVTFLMRLFE